MASREIMTKFRLEGGAEYQRAMKESADAVKVLASEQRLAAAEFESTGDAQEYAAETARILKDQIREQERAVQAAKDGLELLRKLGVDPNDKAMQQWNIRLNTAKTRLTNMQSQLNKANTDLQNNKGKLDESENSAKGFGDQLDRIGKNIDFTATITAIGNIKDKIEGVLKAAARVAKGVWEMGTDAGKWADDLATAASKAGLDVETYQSWQYASMFIDTEVTKISSTITKLEKELGSENTEVAKAFNMLHVRTREAGGGVRDATDVFWDVVDALHAIEDPTVRSIRAQEILGQSWKDLNPLIEEGSKAYKDYAEEGLKTSVISKENVEALGRMNDSQNKLNAAIQKAKFDSLSALAPTFETVSDALSTAVGALNDFLQSEEGQEALSDLNDALSGVIDSFLGEDSGKGTFQSIVEGASGALNTLNDALKWVQDNGDLIKDIVLGLVAAWTGLTVTDSVLSLLQLLQKVPLAKLTAAFGSAGAAGAAGAAAASGAAGAAGTAAAGAAGATLSGLATNAFSGASSVVNFLLSKLGLAGIGTLYGVPMLDFFKDPSKYTKPEAKEKYEELNVDPLSGLRSAAKNPSAVREGLRALLGAGDSAAAKEATEQIAEETAESMEKTISEKINSANWETLFRSDPNNEIWQKIFGEFDPQWALNNWEQAGAYMQQAIQQESPNGELSITLHDKGAELAGAALDGAEERLNDGTAEILGYNFSIGLANGIVSGQGEVERAAQAVSKAAQVTAQITLGIASPSRVMARLGAYVSQGFAEGIDRGVEGVRSAVSRMSGAAFSVPVSAAGQGPRLAFAGAGQGAAAAGSAAAPGQNIHATIVMDKKIVGYMVAPVVNEAIGAIVEEARA